MPHPLIESLYGSQALPCPEDQLLKKLLNDTFFLMKVQESVSLSYGEHAISQIMNSLERAAFRKRLGPVAPRGPALEVKWNLSEGLDVMFLRAALVRGGTVVEEIRFDGPPENLPLLTFKGESVPGYIVQQYTERYRPHLTLSPEYFKSMLGKSDAEKADAKASQETLERQREAKTA